MLAPMLAPMFCYVQLNVECLAVMMVLTVTFKHQLEISPRLVCNDEKLFAEKSPGARQFKVRLN
jgi:hypothetical protein